MRHKLSLDEQVNPEFYALAREHNALMDRWNQYNSQVHEFRVPKLILFTTRKSLRSIGKDISQLQKDFTDWHGRGRKFCNKPHYTYDPEQPVLLVFLHIYWSDERFVGSS